MSRRPTIAASVGALLLALAACGEPDEDLAEFGELCGVEGPVRLLELEPDQVVIYKPTRIGDRLFYDVGRPSSPGPALGPWTSFVDEQRWMTGLCGEAPMRLDADYSRVFEIERWPGLALACDHAENIVSLAATGPLEPNVVFSGTGCDPIWSAHGPISPLGEMQRILHPFPHDPRGETAPWIVLPGFFQSGGLLPRVTTAGDELLVLRPTGELVSIDLRDNTVTLEQPDVGAFVASPSGRYFLWNGEQEAGEFPAILHDRETGQGVFLGDLNLSSNRSALLYAEQGLVFPYLPTEKLRFYHLPNLEFVELPVANYRLDHHGPLADGRWIVSGFPDSALHTLDLATGSLSPMFARPAQVLAHEPEGALVLEAPPCCFLARADDEGPVWFIPHDGSPPTRIAARSTLFGWRPRADSLITLVDISSNRRARLVRVDTATRAEQLIDDHVFAAYLEDPVDRDIIRYSVQDGARSGVWQVRLPP